MTIARDDLLLRRLFGATLAAVLLLAVAACDDTGDEAGEAVEETGEAVGEAAEEAGEAVEDATN